MSFVTSTQFANMIRAMREDMTQRVGINNIPSERQNTIRFRERFEDIPIPSFELIEDGDIVLWERNSSYTMIMYRMMDNNSTQFVTYYNVEKEYDDYAKWDGFSKEGGFIATNADRMRDTWVSGTPYRLIQNSTNPKTLNYSRRGFTNA